MERRPESLLLTFPGTNCDRETARALRYTGFEVEVCPLGRVSSDFLSSVDLLVLSGGFSYGDYIRAGRIARLEIERICGEEIRAFRDRGGLILGICNGFQILLDLEMLPGASLVSNEQGRFVCRWTQLKSTGTNSLYFSKLPNSFELPVAHAEGRFVSEPGAEETFEREGLVPVKYQDNPNGSVRNIAALEDSSGRVLGMMPHPERFLFAVDHYNPDWHPEEKQFRTATYWDGSDHDPTFEEYKNQKSLEPGWGYFFFRSIYQFLVSDRGG